MSVKPDWNPAKWWIYKDAGLNMWVQVSPNARMITRWNSFEAARFALIIQLKLHLVNSMSVQSLAGKPFPPPRYTGSKRKETIH